MVSAVLAILSGLLLGMIALFPGFHFSMVLLTTGPWILAKFGLTGAILCMTSAACSAKAMHTLAVVYHPVSASNIASADPAQRLAASGQGKYATALMGESLWVSVQFMSIILGILLLVSQMNHVNIIKEITRLGAMLTLPAMAWWVYSVIQSSKEKIGTIVAMAASGILGVFALMSPQVEGSTHSMTPLLTGLFALPVLLGTLMEKHSSRKKIHLEKQEELEIEPGIKVLGLLAGLVSVILPGLGTSSLVSVGQQYAETDADYLTMASFAESTGELLALVLGILSIASRSSDAAIIQQVIEKNCGEYAMNPAFGFLLIGTIVVSCWAGIRLTHVVSFPYRVLMNLIPVKLQALIVAITMIGLVWHHTEWWGLGILLAGTLIHLGAKKLYTSNQVFFACMVVPMVLSMLRINPFQ